MLKRISVTQLRAGMHLHELCGSWLDNPFWRSAVKLDNPEDLARIHRSGILEAWIDTDKGLDVADDDGDVTVAYVPVPVPAANALAPALPVIVNRVSFEEELARAAKICGTARRAVMSMFDDTRMGKALDADSVRPLIDDMTLSIARNPGALIGLARLKTKDDYTYMHSVAVGALMISLARQLGLNDSQTRDAGMAGLLHDIGKMAVPPRILDKPGVLTDAEFTIVKSHPVAGHKILSEGSGIPAIALDVCLHHHEKVSGAGYPHGLAGDAISLFSKMGAVCDVYDAVTSNRPYKNGWCPAEAIGKMSEWSGHFDKTVFQAFVKSIGIYPVGSLVRLESGRLGIVIEQTEKSLLSPRVKIFFSTKSLSYISPEVLDLAAPGRQDKIVSREDGAKWGLRNTDEFWLPH
ncbi:MAG: HD-GYP domain-containing protein [Herminiimonas sp.]|nr:HD-GYP domain-containing protein [Herminiimonas sp.]